MASKESKNRKRKGLIVTTTVHVIALVLFCLFGFEIIDPKPGGMEIEWAVEGVEDAGGENNQDNTSEETSQENQTPQETNSASASSSQEEQIQTDDNSDVAVESSPVKTPIKTKTPPNEVKETKPDDSKTTQETKSTRPSWMNDIETKRTTKQGPNSSGGEGDGKNTGKQGTPDGGGTSKSGKGVGDGRWDVQGRAATKVDKKTNSCNATGKINVYIKIDQSGKVYSAIARGGTTQDACLIKVAIDQAKAIKYAPSNSKNEGIITIDLSL